MMRWLATRALELLLDRVGDRAPDAVSRAALGGPVYMLKWHMIPDNRWFNVHLHQWFHGDDRRHMHDHQWSFLSWVLAGHLVEKWRKHGCERTEMRLFGDMYFRHALTPHRVIIPADQRGKVFTLLVTGPTWRTWRLHNRNGGSYPHTQYLAAQGARTQCDTTAHSHSPTRTSKSRSRTS